MASNPQLHIAIVGAGLGGLAAAISISLSGHRATILEQASELGEVYPSPTSTEHYLTRLGWSRHPNPSKLLKYPTQTWCPRPDQNSLHNT